MEDHPPNRDLRLQDLDEMPGDRLAFAVLVSREQELVSVREPLLERVDDLLLVLVDDVERLERMLDVDTQRAEAFPLRLGNVRSAVGEVANMADARLHGELADSVQWGKWNTPITRARDGHLIEAELFDQRRRGSYERPVGGTEGTRRGPSRSLIGS